MRLMTSVVWLTLCGCVLGLAACGDDDGSGGESPSCTEACDALVGCDSAIDAGTCLSECEVMSAMGQAGFVGVVKGCISGDCDQIEGCLEGAQQNCSSAGDVTGLIDAACGKVIECPDVATTFDACREHAEEDHLFADKCYAAGASGLVDLPLPSFWCTDCLSGDGIGQMIDCFNAVETCTSSDTLHDALDQCAEWLMETHG